MKVKKLMKNLETDNEVLYIVKAIPEEHDLTTDVCCPSCVVEKYGEEKISQWFVIDDRIVIVPENANIDIKFFGAYDEDDEDYDREFWGD